MLLSKALLEKGGLPDHSLSSVAWESVKISLIFGNSTAELSKEILKNLEYLQHGLFSLRKCVSQKLPEAIFQVLPLVMNVPFAAVKLAGPTDSPL